MQTTTQTHALQIIDSLITSIELAEKQLQLLPTVTPEIKIKPIKTKKHDLPILHQN